MAALATQKHPRAQRTERPKTLRLQRDAEMRRIRGLVKEAEAGLTVDVTDMSKEDLRKFLTRTK